MIPSGALSSGTKEADGQVVARDAQLIGVTILTNGSADATVELHAGTDTEGKKLFHGLVVGANKFGAFFLPVAVYAPDGIYLNITGTGASCIVYYI